MSYKSFLDQHNRRWEVWLVVPMAAERRSQERRVATGSAAQTYTGVERRITQERRRNPLQSRGAVVLPGFENGWLCFQSSEGEKRRLVPVPDGWDAAESEQLSLWCTSAIRVMKCGP